MHLAVSIVENRVVSTITLVPLLFNRLEAKHLSN